MTPRKLLDFVAGVVCMAGLWLVLLGWAIIGEALLWR